MVKGSTTRRESQVIRTIPTPQASPTSLCSHLRTSLKTSISGWRMWASRNTSGVLRQIRAVGSAGGGQVRPGRLGRPMMMTSSLRAGRGAPEEPAVGDFVDTAVAEGIAAEQAPAGQDGPPHRAQLADRLHRVLRAGRVIAAARGEGGGNEALVEADGRDQQRGERPFHDKRSSPPSSTSSAREAS